LFLIAFGYQVVAQDDIAVENISTQKNAGKLLISYDLTGSRENQSFKVTVSFRDKNNILDTLKRVSGDVGVVKGGKTQFLVVWDYSSDKRLDINNMKKIEVDAQLINDEPQIAVGTKNNLQNTNGLKNSFVKNNKEKGRAFIALELLGLKAGYIGNWGFGINSGLDMLEGEFSLLGSVSKRIVNTQNFKLHIYPLIGIHDTFHSDTIVLSAYPNYEAILIQEYKIGLAYGAGTSLSLGKYLYLNVDYYIDTQKYKHMMAGIGWRF